MKSVFDVETFLSRGQRQNFNPLSTRTNLHSANFFYYLNNHKSCADFKRDEIDISFEEVGVVLTDPTNGKYQKCLRHKKTKPIRLEDEKLKISQSRTRVPCYGIKVRNTSEENWFVTLLYFSGPDHTIGVMHAA